MNKNSAFSSSSKESLSLIREGKVKIYSYVGKPSKKLPVFYNPVMKDNRTLTVLLLKAIKRESLRIALPLAASGVRGARLLKELPSDFAKEILFNDINPKALEFISKNIELNCDELEKNRIKLFNEDGKFFLLKNKPFDYIDIDPFGTPNPFLDAAVSSLKNNGILAVTATDTAPLCGTYRFACIRKYWSVPLHNYLMNEIGLRILIRKVQLIGLNYEFALIPIFSYVKNHYFRIFFKAIKSKQKCMEIFNQHKQLVFIDSEALLTLSQSLLQQIRKLKKGSLMVDNLLDESAFFNFVNKKLVKIFQRFGPIWTGVLYDSELVSRMAQLSLEYEASLQKFLNIILAESKINIIGFYDVHALSKILKKNSPRKSEIIESLKEKGFFASETHFNPTAIKTDATFNDLIKLF